MGTSIYAGEQSVDIGCPVIKWDEDGGFDFTPKKKYNVRSLSFEDLQNTIKQFAVHWSVTYTAKSCFQGLLARGLSVNFIIDDDSVNNYATVYQCLDITHGAWSQGGVFNNLGSGVEIAYMPQAWENKNLYSEANQQKYNVQPHETAMATVHGQQMLVFTPTEAQINSLVRLIAGYTQLFPNVPAKFPRDSDDNVITTVLPDAESYSGIVNHYNLTRNKIDTAGLNYVDIEQAISDANAIPY
jgi:hypothetical protein